MTDSIDWTDQTYRTLDELARIAFPGTGVTADTLKRLARKGQLTVYRPGRVYISNLANVAMMMQLTKIVSAERSPDRGRKQAEDLPNSLGLTSSDLASMALDAALEKLKGTPEERMERAKKRAVRVSQQKEEETKKRPLAKARQVYRDKRDQKLRSG